jgi:ParB-like chromosome segregation protein Spo0J
MTAPSTSPVTTAPALATQPQAVPQSWRDVLDIHPAASLFDPISRDELLDLGKDIKEHGLQSPVALIEKSGQKSALVDGRNRLDAMELVGLEVVYDGKLNFEIIHTKILDAETDPHEFVFSANIRRRHLSSEDKRHLIAKLIKQQPDKSSLQVAKLVGASPTTVTKVRGKLLDVFKMETSTDTKGRKQPVKKKRRTEEDFRKDIASKKAAVVPTTAKTVREVVAVDEELALLRDFARFIVSREAHGFRVDPKDRDEWRLLHGRVKALLGVTP